MSRSSNYYSVKEAPPPPVLEEGWREKEMLREEEEERRLREELLMDKRAKVLNKLLEKRLEQLGEEGGEYINILCNTLITPLCCKASVLDPWGSNVFGFVIHWRLIRREGTLGDKDIMVR